MSKPDKPEQPDAAFAPTRPEDVFGSLAHEGPAKSIADIKEARPHLDHDRGPFAENPTWRPVLAWLRERLMRWHRP